MCDKCAVVQSLWLKSERQFGLMVGHVGVEQMED